VPEASGSVFEYAGPGLAKLFNCGEHVKSNMKRRAFLVGGIGLGTFGTVAKAIHPINPQKNSGNDLEDQSDKRDDKGSEIVDAFKIDPDVDNFDPDVENVDSIDDVKPHEFEVINIDRSKHTINVNIYSPVEKQTYFNKNYSLSTKEKVAGELTVPKYYKIVVNILSEEGKKIEKVSHFDTCNDYYTHIKIHHSDKIKTSKMATTEACGTIPVTTPKTNDG